MSTHGPSNKARMTNDKSRGAAVAQTLESRSRLTARINESLTCIETVLRNHQRPLLAFSGGKDSLVIAHLLAQYGPQPAIAEVSFLFPFLVSSLIEAGQSLQLQLTCKDSLDLAWLSERPRFLFPRTSKDAATFYQARQQKTVTRHSERNNYDVVFFGRRLEENSVKAMVYDKSGVTQCHPLRHWTHDDIWLYLAIHHLPVPDIYQSAFGRNAGNGPWNIFMGSTDVQECWSVIHQTHPPTVAQAASYFHSARQFLEQL